MKLPNTFPTFLKLILSLASIVIALYIYIDRQNELIELRIKVRALNKELREIQENNVGLQYEVDRFESPVHLMELAQEPAFGHLKYPYTNEIIIITEKQPLSVDDHK